MRGAAVLILNGARRPIPRALFSTLANMCIGARVLRPALPIEIARLAQFLAAWGHTGPAVRIRLTQIKGNGRRQR
jgi:hypothetical protein